MQETHSSFLDADIRDIQELKRMASNPVLMAVMRKIVYASDAPVQRVQQKPTANQSGSLLAPVAASAAQEKSQPNGLTPKALEAIRGMGKPFTIPEIVDTLIAGGFTFVASKPKVAVAAPLKIFMKRGWVRLVKPGVGSEPHTYEYVGENLAQ